VLITVVSEKIDAEIPNVKLSDTKTVTTIRYNFDLVIKIMYEILTLREKNRRSSKATSVNSIENLKRGSLDSLTRISERGHGSMAGLAMATDLSESRSMLRSASIKGEEVEYADLVSLETISEEEARVNPIKALSIRFRKEMKLIFRLLH